MVTKKGIEAKCGGGSDDNSDELVAQCRTEERKTSSMQNYQDPRQFIFQFDPYS